MRQLTFRGFLERYVQSLSGKHTTSIYANVREINEGNYRLREPLFLYAASTGKLRVLLRAAKGTALFEAYQELAEDYSGQALFRSLENEPTTLPPEYARIWHSFQSEKRMGERDVRLKTIMRERVLALQKEKGITAYRICKDLGLNNANVNAWLKNAAQNKVGIHTARAVLTYVEQR